MYSIFLPLENSTVTEFLSATYQNFNIYLESIVNVFSQSKGFSTIFTDLSTNLQDTLNFNEFQVKLLIGFGVFLIINLILIAISWFYFGKLICDRFMKPATSKAIEELRASVSRLKLPKEHTPRI